LILQPFGCLPNHVVGRGISKKLKEMYPNAQILPLDYDPDVSFANIENRLQMLVMNAKQEILEENEERDHRRSHHYTQIEDKNYRGKSYNVGKTSGV
jgi:predicted nucleotide-binding protein (sugar kinase/HSP70/actin superfamily)